MALPEYDEVYEWMHGRGLEPLPAPRKRPTRKGLGRYVRDVLMELENDGTVKEWRMRWFACTGAYEIMLDEFRVRLPSTTFLMDRLMVEADLVSPDRSTEWSPDRQQALRWARSR